MEDASLRGTGPDFESGSGSTLLRRSPLPGDSKNEKRQATRPLTPTESVSHFDSVAPNAWKIPPFHPDCKANITAWVGVA